MKNFLEFLSEKNIYSILKHNDLTRRGGSRVDVFLKKIKDKEGFLTKKGEVFLKPPPPDKKTFVKPGYKQDFDTMKKGKVKYPSDFFKGPEFGGKGVGFGTRAEDAFLKAFREELEKTIAKEKTGALDMIVGRRKMVIAGVESTPGVPKSDFHLLDDMGREAAWISHKAGKTAKDFQQYGGLSNKVFKGNADVEKFVKDVKEMFPDGFQRKQSVFRKVKDNNIARLSVWGVDYGKARGRNNIDEFHQGTMKLVKSGKYYTIQSAHSDTNGSVPKEGYTCIYYARFTSDMDSLGVKNSRIGVFALAQMPSTAKEI